MKNFDIFYHLQTIKYSCCCTLLYNASIRWLSIWHMINFWMRPWFSIVVLNDECVKHLIHLSWSLKILWLKTSEGCNIQKYSKRERDATIKIPPRNFIFSHWFWFSDTKFTILSNSATENYEIYDIIQTCLSFQAKTSLWHNIFKS